MIDTTLFPYENFPVRLELKSENRVCWFKDNYDLQKYLERYRLDKRTLKIDYHDEPPVTSKTNKRGVEQKSKPKSNRSTSPVRKGKSSMDTSGNTTRSTKFKK